MKKLSSICMLFVLASLPGCSRQDSVQAAKPQQAPAAPVRVATVASRNMPVQLQAIGNVEAISTVSIKAQISGQLMRVHFKEGDFVKKGQLLFTIDRAPFEAALRQAEGTLAKDRAQALNANSTLSAMKDWAAQAWFPNSRWTHPRLLRMPRKPSLPLTRQRWK